MILNDKMLYLYDYNNKTVNIEQRVGIGNPGKHNSDRTKIGRDDPDTQDKINMAPLVTNTSVPDFGTNIPLLQ